MSTLRQSLRRVLARTLRRGASWLDRLAVRVTPATPAAPDADDWPTGGPPAHWRQRVHRPPPAHWLVRIRQQAPHLLDGEALAGTGWARISVSPPAIPPVGVTPTVDEAAPRPLPDDRPTGQTVASIPPRRAMPLFAGRALHLRRTDTPQWAGRGASPADARPESSAPSLAPAGSPATALSESPTDLLASAPNSRVQPPGRESANRRAAPTAAVAQAAAGRTMPESPNPPLAPPAESPASRSSRTGPGGFSPLLAVEPSAGSTPGSYPAAASEAAPAGAADTSPAGSTAETRNWTSAAPPPNASTAQPDTTPDLAAPDFKAAATAHESAGWTRAAPWPAWRAVRPTGAPEQLDASAAAVQPDHRAALPWPALPDWPDTAEPEPNPHEAVRQHLQRLDREQRGLLWNESPF